MSLQTIINLHCPDALKFYLVGIRNSDPTSQTSSTPIVDSADPGSNGFAFNFTAGNWTQSCSDATAVFRPLEPICLGESFILPPELHCPNRHMGVELWESTFNKWQASTAYNVTDTVTVYDGAGEWEFLECSVAGTTGVTMPTGAGVDGTAAWIVSATSRSDLSNYRCNAGAGAGAHHWTGDMDFQLLNDGPGFVAQDGTYSGTVAVSVDGQVINTSTLFSETLNIAASAGILGTVVNANGWVDYTVDATGLAAGTVITVTFDVNVKASTNVATPVCRALTGRHQFIVQDPAGTGGDCTLTDEQIADLAAQIRDEWSQLQCGCGRSSCW